MAGEEPLLTLDYSLDGHELYITVTRHFTIREIHFRTDRELRPPDFLQFMSRTFNLNRKRVHQLFGEFLRQEPE